MNPAIQRIVDGSLVTLHYSVAVAIDEPPGAVVGGATVRAPGGGSEDVDADRVRTLVDTFAARPATLTIGCGQLAAGLEDCLRGLAEGERRRFDLPADAAFGARRPELVQTFARALFAELADQGEKFGPGDLIDVAVDPQLRMAGVVKQCDAERVVVDFNHPLAGLPVRFEVHVLGII